MDAGVAAVIVASIAAISSTVSAYISRQAQKNTQPIGNGWGRDVRDRLSRIEDLILDHLKDHADSERAKRN